MTSQFNHKSQTKKTKSFFKYWWLVRHVAMAMSHFLKVLLLLHHSSSVVCRHLTPIVLVRFEDKFSLCWLLRCDDSGDDVQKAVMWLDYSLKFHSNWTLVNFVVNSNRLRVSRTGVVPCSIASWGLIRLFTFPPVFLRSHWQQRLSCLMIIFLASHKAALSAFDRGCVGQLS